MHGERLFRVGVVCTQRGCLLTELYAWGETVFYRDGMHTERLSPGGAVCMGRDCFL